MRRNAVDDDPERMFRNCVIPRAWTWRLDASLRLWHEYLDGVDHPRPIFRRFDPGRLYVTSAARKLLAAVEEFASEYVQRHCHLDYGIASYEDRLVNEEALRARGWILSGYLLMPSNEKLLVLTRLGGRTFVFVAADI